MRVWKNCSRPSRQTTLMLTKRGCESVALNPKTVEDEKVASAIKTDVVLSAEIMAITLAAIPEIGIWMQALVLALVGVGITVVVYGMVALIVKADDLGLALAQNDAHSTIGELSRAVGSALVVGIPIFLARLGAVGTAAMIWVGGGIIVHGLDAYGLNSISWAIHQAAEAAARAVPWAAGVVQWTVGAVGSGVVGVLVGGAFIPVIQFIFAPAWNLLKNSLWRKFR